MQEGIHPVRRYIRNLLFFSIDRFHYIEKYFIALKYKHYRSKIRMKKVLLILFSALLISQAGCLGSLIKNSAKDTPLNNKMLLHRYARVGDYAIFRGANDTAQVKMKIVAKIGGLYQIRTKTGLVLPGIGFRNTLTIDVYTDSRGNVKKGYLIDGDEKTPLKVAAPGQNEYRLPYRLSAAQKREFDLGSTVTVRAGTFKVSTVAFKSREKDKDTIIVYQTNSRAKFMHVAGYSLIKNGSEYQKHPALEMIEQGNRR